MPTFTRGRGPLSAEQVDEFAGRSGVELPDDYRQFLLTDNGGIPSPDQFEPPGGGYEMVRVLYGIRPERGLGDLEFEQQQRARYGPLPPGFIVIGRSRGGVLLLSTRGPDAGWVYLQEIGGQFRAMADGQNKLPVARTFSAFLASLRKLPL